MTFSTAQLEAMLGMADDELDELEAHLSWLIEPHGDDTVPLDPGLTFGEFIAQYRTHLPRLIAEVRRLKRALAYAEALHNYCRECKAEAGEPCAGVRGVHESRRR